MAVRLILCPDCAAKESLHPEDIARGLTERRVPLARVRVPEGHGHVITETGKPKLFIEMKEIHCDRCNGVIKGPAVAVTQWREVPGTPQPPHWEKQYEL